MGLSTDDRMKLRAALSLAFQDFEQFGRFLSDYCSRLVSDWTDRQAGMETVIFSSVARAERDDWLDDFLIALKQHGPRSVASTATTTMAILAAQRPALYRNAVADPLGALFLADGECFIGRQELRKGLRLLKNNSNNVSVLCVNGDPGTGKSYSFELLKLLDNLSSQDVVVRIDFKDFREGALAERYRSIVYAINTRLQIPFDKIPPYNETEPRWFENAIITFDNVVRERDQHLWLVFDHVAGKSAIEPNILDALSKLVKYATLESQRLRIVLIEMPNSRLLLERGSAQRVKSDIAAIPTAADISDFLRAVRIASDVTLDDRDIDAAVDEIVASLEKLPAEDSAWELSSLTWGQVERLALIGARP